MNLFANIPVLAGNGAGAPVNVAAMGAGKTIVVGGPFDASVTIEYATDDTGTVFASVPNATFDGPGRVTVDLACRWLRAVTEAYKGGVPNADVGGSGSGTLFAALVVGGPAVDVSLLPSLKTVVVDDAFVGAINIEVSEDGVSWSQAMTFNDGGGQTQLIYAQFMRATGSGALSIWVGGASQEGAGPSDSGSGGNFVLRPGGVPGGNVYTTWPSVVAAANLVQGYKTIQVDSSLAPAATTPGSWDLTDTEICGLLGGAFFGQVPSLEIVEGTLLNNLRYIGNDLEINNSCNLQAPIVIPPGGGSIEIGLSPMGAFPLIFNNGLAPFVDASGLTGGFGALLVRLQCRIAGTGSPAFQFGAAPAGFRGVFILSEGAEVRSNHIAGSDPGQFIVLQAPAPNSTFARQSTFAGVVGSPAPNGGPGGIGGGFPRSFYLPAPPAPPSAVAFTPAAGLGMNTVLRFDTTLAIAQPLPLIRAVNPGIGVSAIDTVGTANGVLESTSLTVTVKNETGANPVNVSPATSVDGSGDAFAIVGTTVTLTDGDGLFTPGMVGAALTIAGATSPANNGVFVVTAVGGGGTTITYTNAAGVTEAFPGTWSVSVTPDTIEGGAGPVAVPVGGARTFMSDGVSDWIIVGGYL